MVQRNGNRRSITADEIKRWFGDRLKPTLSDAHCATLAAELNSFRWGGDPPPSPGSPGYVEECDADETDEFDFKEARKLLQCLPPFAQRISTCALKGYSQPEVLERLNATLSEAMPTINFFSPPHRADRTKSPKPWHTYARLISYAVIEQMVKARHSSPAISRKAVVVRIVKAAMIRMGIEGAHVSDSAISAYLTRWDKRAGLTPKGIAALTTNEVRAFNALSA